MFGVITVLFCFPSNQNTIAVTRHTDNCNDDSVFYDEYCDDNNCDDHEA